MVATDFWIRADGGWRNVPFDDNNIDNHGFFVRVNGTYVRVLEGWVWANGGWRKFYPGEGDTEPPPTKPPAGSYTLQPTAQFYGSGSTGYAQFNTDAYRGYITEIRARISWKSITAAIDTFGIRGRPNNRFYRNVDNPGQWSNRTIDHRIDTFNATSLTDFNNGNAIGFNFTYSTSRYSMNELLSKTQLVIQVS